MPPSWPQSQSLWRRLQHMNPTTNASVVYVVQCGSTNFLKIGYSENLQKRIESPQIGSPYPLQLLATWPGGWSLEQHLHRRFADLRQKGEWFYFPHHRQIEIYYAVMAFNVEAGNKAIVSRFPRKRLACSCPIPRITHTEWRISSGYHQYRIMMDRWFENGVAKYARSKWMLCTCDEILKWEKTEFAPIAENVRRIREEYFSNRT